MIVTVRSEPTRTSRVVADAWSAGSVTVTLTNKSGWPSALNVKTASPADEPLMLNVATPEIGFTDSSTATSALLDSTVTGWPATRAKSELIVATFAAAPVTRPRE